MQTAEAAAAAFGRVPGAVVGAVVAVPVQAVLTVGVQPPAGGVVPVGTVLSAVVADDYIAAGARTVAKPARRLQMTHPGMATEAVLGPSRWAARNCPRLCPRWHRFLQV